MVPVTIDGETVKLATITYKPDGPGPFPTLIFHHGSTGRGTDPPLFDPALRSPRYWPTGSRSAAGQWCCRRGAAGVGRRAFTMKASRSIAAWATPASRPCRLPAPTAHCVISMPSRRCCWRSRSSIAARWQSAVNRAAASFSVAWQRPATRCAACRRQFRWRLARRSLLGARAPSTKTCSSAVPRTADRRSGSTATRTRSIRWLTACSQFHRFQGSRRQRDVP